MERGYIPYSYEGEWRNGKKHGWGTQLSVWGHYEGKWSDDELQSGVQYFGNSSHKMYEGEFRDFEWHGKEPGTMHTVIVIQATSPW